MTSWVERPALRTALGVVGTAVAGLVVGMAASTGPTLALVGTAMLVLACLAFSSLMVGVVLMTLLTFFEAMGALGGGVTAVKLVGAIVILSWLALVLSHRGRAQLLLEDEPFLGFVVLGLLVWASASTLWAPDPAAAAGYLTRLIPIAALLFVVYTAVRNTRHLRVALWAYVAGAVATTLYGVGTGLASEDRLIAGIANPNDLAGALVPAIAFAIALAATARRPVPRLAAIGAVVPCLLGVFMTQSRAGLLSLATAMVVALLLGGRLRPYFAVLLVVMVTAGVSYLSLATTATERVRLQSISAAGSSGRADEWQIAARLARDHPLVGVGVNNFRELETRYVADDISLYQVHTSLFKNPVTHNTYLSVLAELGLVGFALLIGMYIATAGIGLRAIRRLREAGDSEGEALGRGVMIAVAALFVAQTFSDSLLHKELWLVLGYVVALAALGRGTGPAPAPVSTGRRPLVLVADP